MQSIKTNTFFILIIGLIFSSFISEKGEDKGYSLTVNVSDLQNSDGIVQFSLYNKDKVFPDEQFERYYKQLKAGIINNSSTITFTNLPKGTYAINIFHDENNNGVIDKGFILPVEGIGFSNFEALNVLNRPNFQKARFDLDVDKTIQVKVIYM